MATYKVLQDIESEDKLFGPFTLKQFIFGAIAIAIAFIGFRILILGIPVFIKLPTLLILLPPLIVFGFMAAPLGRDQPNDVWLLARLRFLFKPRRRIWDQDGISNLVTITAPKRDDYVYTNNFTQSEVKSRLSALASTLDSRGWAVKNVNANLFAQPGYLTSDTGSDRLLTPTDLPQQVSNVDVRAADDILDAQNNPTAQHLDQMMQQSAAALKQRAASKVVQSVGQNPAQTAGPQDYWFMNQPETPQTPQGGDYSTFSSSQVVAPGTNDAVQAADATEEEKALARKLADEKEKSDQRSRDRYRVVQPLHDRDGNLTLPPVKQEASAKQPAPTANPAVQRLAQNDDLNISTISREANRAAGNDNGEVTIKLH